MGYIVRMPKLGVAMKSGRIVEWIVEEGERVAEGGEVVVVESDKVAHTVEAKQRGVLRDIYLEGDRPVEPLTPIGIIATEDEDISALREEVKEGAT